MFPTEFEIYPNVQHSILEREAIVVGAFLLVPVFFGSIHHFRYCTISVSSCESTRPEALLTWAH